MSPRAGARGTTPPAGALSRPLKRCSSPAWAEATSPRRLRVPASGIAAAARLRACPRARASHPIAGAGQRRPRLRLRGRVPAASSLAPRAPHRLPPLPAPPPLPGWRRDGRRGARTGQGRGGLGGGGARARARRGARAGPRAPRGWKRLFLATPPFAVTEVWGRCHRLLVGGGAQRGVESGSPPETRRTPISHLPKGVSRVLFSQPEVVLRGHSKRPAGPPEVYGATGGQGSARESGEAGGHLPHLPSHSPFRVTSRGLRPSGVTKP
ncbi:uncharacterized protein LOC132660863 [Panthera onca]